jgi:type VI secretion system protein ImpF
LAALDLVEGARAPLFDRFFRDGEGARADSTLLDWHRARQEGGEPVLSALEASIEQELGRLLNTRCACSLAELATRERSVVDYGLPDYSALYTNNTDDQARLVELVRGTIEAFEPRLRQVAVQVDMLGNSRHALRVRIQAMVLIEGRLEPVSFRIGANEEGGP